MTNKGIAIGLIASVSLAVLNAMGADADGIYTLAGLGMMVFSIMASVRLWKI